ncbi:photosystem II reaction center PsbP [Gloeomargarita sp.]
MRWLWLGLVVLVLGLTGCGFTPAGLNPYVDTVDGYQFLYPNGWVRVQPNEPSRDGLDILFHDLIDPSETVSMVISTVKSGKTLAELGSPLEVGQRLLNTALAQAAVDQKPELVSADSRQDDQQLYYTLEYVVNTKTGRRHNIAAIATRHGKLYTLNASVPESRWAKLAPILQRVVNSLQVY